MLKEDLINRLVTSPAVACLSPKVIYSKPLGMRILVPCRRCSACLDIKSSLLSLRVSKECTQHKYAVFFTLTYDDAHLPYYECVDRFTDDYGVTYLTFQSSWREVVNSHYQSKVFTVPLSYLRGLHYYKGAVVPSVCKYDVQKFLKRLRKNLSKYTNEKIRYFISSEYGPSTHRPHYHGIIWTDSKEVADLLLGVRVDRFGKSYQNTSDSLIYSSWSLCRPVGFTCDIVCGSASQYVASYCTSFSNLPKVFQTKFTMPFIMASKNPIIGLFSSNEEDICNALCNRTIKLGFIGLSSCDVLPMSVFRKYFGVPNGFRKASLDDLLRMYKKYSSGAYSLNRQTKDLSICDSLKTLSPFFDYTHYLFIKKVIRFCSVPHVFTHVYNGVVSRSTYRLTPEICLSCIYDLKQDYISYENERFYTSCQASNGFDYLSKYCNTLIELPERVFDDIQLCYNLSSYGLTPDEFHYLYYIDPYYRLGLTSEISWILNRDKLLRLYHLHRLAFAHKHELHIKHSNSTKIFNDKQNLLCQNTTF